MPILDDICTAKTKGIAAKDVAQTGKYPVFGATGLVGYLDTFEVENEYVGIIKDGAGVGRTNIYPAKSSLLGTMQYILPKENTDIKYLMYLLRSLNLGCSSAGAAIPHIYFKNYKKNIVPNFDLNKQRCISKLLEKIENLIVLKKKQLFSLDELVKSRFIEMFDTIDMSEERKDWVELEKISKIYSGTTPSTKDAENWNGDIHWITPAEMNKDTFYITDTVRKITEKGRKSKSLEMMPTNTVLLSTRAPIGKVGITGVPMTCNQGFKNFGCGDKLNPIYLYILLKENTEYLNSLGSGTTFLEVSKSKIAKTKIPVPPIELQNNFAEFVKQVDKSKFIVQKQIEDLQELLDSKMDEYFG